MSRGGAHYEHVADDEVSAELPTFLFDDAMEQIGFGKYHMLLMQACGAGYFFDGIELAMTSFIVPILLVEWNISYVAGGALASVVFLGMAFGAYLGGIIADRFGRKVVFCGSVFIVSCFGTMSAFAPNYATLITLRVFVGLGLGSLPPTDYSMLMEFSPKSSRGLAMGGKS
jgi:putative MFS transporter